MKRLIVLTLVLLIAVGSLVAYAQDGRQPITEGNGTSVVEVMRLGRGTADVVAYAPDGSLIAVGGSVGVWFFDNVALETITEPPVVLASAPVTAVAFSPDGSLVAISEGRTLRLVDMASLEELATLDTRESGRFLSFSPDGLSLLTVGENRNSAHIISVLDQSVTTRLEGHTSAVRDAVFAPDGSVLVTVAEDNSVRLWDTNGESLAVLSGHTGRVVSVAFSPDGSLLATSSADNTIRVWNVLDSSEQFSLQQESSPRQFNVVAFSPDGSLLAGGNANGSVYLWAADSGEQLAQIETGGGEVLDLAFNPAKDFLVTVGRNESVKLWNLLDATEAAAAVGFTDRMSSVDFSPDSRFLLLGNSDKFVWLWDTEARLELNQNPVLGDALASANDTSNYLLFFPDGSLFLTLDGFDARIYETASGAELVRLRGSGLTSSAAISPDGTLVAYVGSDGGFLFDLFSGELLASLDGHTGWVKTIAFSPDQSMIATGADDGTVRVWGLP